jgi:hypothetical protein
MLLHGRQDNSTSIIVARDELSHYAWQKSDVICIMYIVFFNYITMQQCNYVWLT